jgi:hypothetical protein
LEAQQHKIYAQTTPLDDGVSSFSYIEFEVKAMWTFKCNLEWSVLKKNILVKNLAALHCMEPKTLSQRSPDRKSAKHRKIIKNQYWV